MGVFQDGLWQLEQMGILDVIVPFILIFTIVFATLQKTKILGIDQYNKPRKNFNAVIALVMALGVVIPHILGTYPEGSDVVTIMNSALPNISLILVAILMALIILGVFGSEVNVGGSSLSSLAVIFAIGATVVVFGSSAGWFEMPSWLYFLQDSDTQALVVVVLVFALIIWFVTKEDKEKNESQRSFFEKIGDVISKPK